MRIRQILVVHPSPSVRTLVERIILADGSDIEVAHAGSGIEATRQLEQSWFDLVITDAGLTDIAPDRIQEAFKAGSRNSDLSLIALAGGDSPGDAARMEADGFNHFVLPPFEPEELHRKINTLCNPRQWRKMGRYHFPDSKVVIRVWGMEAESRMINISQGGVLVEAVGDRSELFLQNSPKLTLKIRLADGYFNIDDIPAKLDRLNAVEWNPEYKPSVMRMVYIFLPMDPAVRERLEQVLLQAGDPS